MIKPGFPIIVLGFLLSLSSPVRAARDIPPVLSPAKNLSLAPTIVEIRDEVIRDRVKRFGIGLSWRDRWGAGQFVKNIIENPGFEATVYNSIILADEGATGQRVPQANWETAWNNETEGIGQPVGFWNGGSFEILSGPARGRRGTITAFTHEANRYVFNLDSTGTAPEQWDAIAVRTEIPGLYGSGSGFSADTSTTRPGSPGSQSLRLIYTGVPWDPAYAYYMDSSWRDGDRSSGKLYIVQGSWHIEFWARGGEAGDQLRVRFFRENEADFFDETITLTAGWQKIERDFIVPAGTDPYRPYTPEEYHPILGLNFYILNPGEEARVDDLALYRTGDTNPTVFTDRIVARLKEFNPGILRDWCNHQFGNTLDNMLAVEWGRKTNGFHPAERFSGRYSYSLHEFLNLCVEIGAEPWCVFSPAFSPEDILGLAEYLAAPNNGSNPYAARRAALGQAAPWTSVFPMIHLEFGNELWGSADTTDPFFGGSLRGGVTLGHVAHDRLQILKTSPFYSASRFDLKIGGQAGWPPRQEEIENNASSHDTIALAPYYQFEPVDYDSDEALYYPVFAQPFDNVTAGIMRESKDHIDAVGQGTGISIYEINFHTTGGAMPIDIRNDLVTGMVGGIALPLHMLVYLRDFGIRDQCAFLIHGYSTNHMVSGDDWVRIWGLLRDLEVTRRKRPTGLGLELINRVVKRNMLRTVQSGENQSWHQLPSNGVLNEIDVTYLQSFAFRSGDSFSVVLFNLDLDQSREVQLELPFSPLGPATLQQIAPDSVHDDNEDGLNVEIDSRRLTDFGDGSLLTLPPHSVTTISWRMFSPRVSGDFDGDGTSDIAIFRERSGLWAIRGQSRAYWGRQGDMPVPGDYNGDGTTDICVFRPPGGLWAIRGMNRTYFGNSTDLPIPADYNGDGRSDIGIYRTSSGLWAFRGISRVYFGGGSDIPVPGDYNGDGSADIAIYRETNSLWALRGRSRIYFGASVVPADGDYNGDGTRDVGIFMKPTGLWAARGISRVYFGVSSDLPVPADYDGDGRDDVGIFRDSNGLWALRTISRLYFGAVGDRGVGKKKFKVPKVR